MPRSLGLLAIVATLCLASGCSMCCHPYDGAYLYQGGSWQRNDPVYGRVGSAFTPEVGSPVAVSVPVEQATPAPTPAPRPNRTTTQPPATRPVPMTRPIHAPMQPTLGERFLPSAE